MHICKLAFFRIWTRLALYLLISVLVSEQCNLAVQVFFICYQHDGTLQTNVKSKGEKGFSCGNVCNTLGFVNQWPHPSILGWQRPDFRSSRIHFWRCIDACRYWHWQATPTATMLLDVPFLAKEEVIERNLTFFTNVSFDTRNKSIFLYCVSPPFAKLLSIGTNASELYDTPHLRCHTGSDIVCAQPFNNCVCTGLVSMTRQSTRKRGRLLTRNFSKSCRFLSLHGCIKCTATFLLFYCAYIVSS